MAESMKVLMAIDNSDYAEYAFSYYMKYIHRAEYQVILLHVVEIPASSISKMSGSMWEEQVQREKDKTASLEKEYKAKIEQNQMNAIITTSHGTKPGENICSMALDEGANMIILGSRGSGKIRRTIMGSVSDYVLHHAHCPVVVCRQEGKQRQPSILQRIRTLSGSERTRRHSETERERKNSENGRERKTSDSEKQRHHSGGIFSRSRKRSEDEKSRHDSEKSTGSNGK